MKPKEAFLKGPHRENHERWATTISAEAARDAAMLEFVALLDRPSDPSKSWDQGCRIDGAKQMLDILLSLHLKDNPQTGMRLNQLPIPK